MHNTIRHSVLLVVGLAPLASAELPDAPPTALRPHALMLDRDALRAAGLQVYWQLPVPVRWTEAIRDVTLLDEHLYVRTDRGRLLAVRADTGLTRWEVPAYEPGDAMFPLLHARSTNGAGPLIVTAPNRARLLDRATGEEVQLVRFEAPTVAATPADDKYVFVAQANGRFVAYRRNDSVVAWAAVARARVTTSPQLLPERVLFDAENGRAVLLRLGDTLSTEHVELKAAPVEPVAYRADDLIFTGTDYFVHSVSLDFLEDRASEETEPLIWRYRLAGRPPEGPALTDGLVLQYAAGAGLAAIDRKNGQGRWLLANGRRLLAVGKDVFYVASTGDDLLIVNQTDGSIRASVALPGAKNLTTNLRTDAVYVADHTRVVCLRPIGASPLRPEDLVPTTQPATAVAGADASTPDGVGDTTPPAAPATVTDTSASDPLQSTIR